MSSMNATGAPATPDSYAPPARRRGFVQAMRKIAATRGPGDPVRVYLSAPPVYRERPNWQHRVDTIRQALPDGVELLDFHTVFADRADYTARWPEFAASLDGLVVTGTRAKPGKTRMHALGSAARQELITLVAAGKPVLLHSMELGLVPVLDCRPKRLGTPDDARLRLLIPRGWAGVPPTLDAALDALRPTGTA
ncbi:hypothetical protein ACIO3O_37645 [Streptomyces sp. NPDC087440]|uniref:hypothetical protein n=1 Tax=Streptomyces sp. NPDC087440 TaxID=3365790 RepID=UPI00380E8B46